MTAISVDTLIVGAGPCGLFQVFELGLLDLEAHVIDALPQVGGQCSELYPDKPIYDIPGFPRVGAGELIDRLMQQIKPFNPTFHLGQQVDLVQPQEGGGFRVTTTAGGEFSARAVVIAGGVGAFQPVLLRVDGIERYLDSQVFYRVRNPEQHHGKRIVVLGGGDSALDWAMQLADKADTLTLVHRSANFKAAPATVSRFQGLVESGMARLVLGSVMNIDERDGRLSALEIRGIDQSVQHIELDHALVFFGLSPKLGPIADWGLTLNKHQIEVSTETFETSTPGIYAVGDINWYPGKKKLILSGFHEAALAAFAIKHRLFPDQKVYLQYTTTSSSVHKKLGVQDPA